ncbi:MAG: tRNA 2-selenouridine(34) synthase MnmH, partial [Casimicrobiaceae bacterium]
MKDVSHVVGTEALAAYADRIDVRSPAEYAEDHVPGAASHPVLSDDERALVGTLHARDSAFAAKRAGAAIVSRNIATMLETAFRDKPRAWSPLVYCWRGGKRSRALTHILNEIGWRAVQLDGGYRAYRRHVRTALAAAPGGFDYRVVCGLTGSGKSRLLRALDAIGAQVLDLEALAVHRGSLLGDLPGEPQPSQKRFESRLLESMERFDRSRPVFVESESKRIGALQVPDALLEAMRAAPCVKLDLPPALRTALLRDEYAHFLREPEALARQLAPLAALHGKATVERWNAAARAGEWDAFVTELLEQHYDPTYARALERNFPRHDAAIVLRPTAIDD